MTIILSIGSNLSPRHQRVADAMCWLHNVLQIKSESQLYETPEIHGKDISYINSVVIADTDESLETINARIKKYEIECGRNEECRARGIVPIDIDIVVVDSEIVRSRDYSCDFFQKGFLELLGSKE